MSIWSKSQFACWQSHASQKPMQLGSPNLTQLGSRTQRSRSRGTKIVPTWFWHSCGRWLFLVGFYVHHVYSSFLCHVNAPRTSVFGICNMIWCGLITDVDQDRPTPLQVATSVSAHALTITYSPPKREIKRSCYPSDFNLYPTCVWRPLKLGLRPSLWLLFHRSFLITFFPSCFGITKLSVWCYVRWSWCYVRSCSRSWCHNGKRVASIIGEE